MADLPALTFTYTNWRGETGVRRVIPETFRFAATEWHPEPQWLLVAFDLDKGVRRDFACKDIVFASAPIQSGDTAMQEAIAIVERHFDENCREHGIYDPSTNAWEFSGAAEDTDILLQIILEELQARLSAPKGEPDQRGKPPADHTDILVRFIAAIDDVWEGEDADMLLLRKLADAGRAALAPQSRFDEELKAHEL